MQSLLVLRASSNDVIKLLFNVVTKLLFNVDHVFAKNCTQSKIFMILGQNLTYAKWDIF